MAAQVITVTSGKGGVGKTTATANLAVALASLGKKVCCIDADIGLRNLDIVLGLENRIVYDLVDVVEGRAKLRQAMIKDKRLEELYLIPAAQTRDKTAVSPSDMVRICDELRTMVDYIIIDSPAGIERGFRNALAPADMVVVVTNPEVSSVRDADRIIGLIEAEDKGPGNLIINRVKPDMVKRGDMLSPEDVIDILAIKLIGLVPEDETILVSTNRGMPAALKPEESRAGVAFQNIARRLTGQQVPFMDMEENKSWTKRLLKAFGIGGGDSSKDEEITKLKPDRPTAAVPAAPAAAPPNPAPTPPAPESPMPAAPLPAAPVAPAAATPPPPSPAATPAPAPATAQSPAAPPPAPTTAVPASTARAAAPPPASNPASQPVAPPAPTTPPPAPPPAAPPPTVQAAAPTPAAPATETDNRAKSAKPAEDKDSAEKPASKSNKVASSANSQPGS